MRVIFRMPGKRRVLTTLRRLVRVFAVMLLGTALSARQCLAHGFPDVPAGAWYEDMLDGALEAGTVRGYEDGTFRPDGTLSYGEFLAMLSGQKEADHHGGFDHWAAGHYAYALERGWISEGSVPVRRLGEPIPRRHMALIAAGAAEAEGLAAALSAAGDAAQDADTGAPGASYVPIYLYSDVGSSDGDEYAISLCSSLGILNGYEDGSFRPDAFLRRCEALKVVTVFEGLRASAFGPVISVQAGGDPGMDSGDPLMELLLGIARSTRCSRNGQDFTVSYEQPQIPDEWYFEYHFLLYGSEAEDYEQLLWYDSEYATPDYSESYDPAPHSVTRRLKGVRSLEGREFIIHLYAYDREAGKSACRELVISYTAGGTSAIKILNRAGGRTRSTPGADEFDAKEVFLW